LDFRRLTQAVPQHFKLLAPHRKSRETLIRTIAGTLYPNNKRRKEIINLLRQAADAEAITLAAGSPRCLITTHDPKLRGFAEHMSRAINRYAERAHLQESLEEFARNAFVGMGVIKCFMGDSPAVMVEADEWLDPGMPCCLAISQDDMVWDAQAKRTHGFAFVGDRYTVPFENIVHDVRIPAKIRTAIKEKGRACLVRQEGDSNMAPAVDEEDIIDRIWLADIFIPTEGKTVTYPIDGDWAPLYSEPLAEQKWTGGESGPYHYLNLGPVPDNSYPSAPGLGLLLLHQLVNSDYNKLEQQAKDMKEINLVQSGNEDDGNKIKNAKNGEFPVVTSVGAVVKARYGGPDQNLFAFTLNCLDQFSKQAGNLDNQLGTGPSADTLGQEQMISASVGSVRGFYQLRFINAVRGIMNEMARLIWHDKITEIPGSLTIPGTAITVPDTWLGAADDTQTAPDGTPIPPRLGAFDDYDLDFEVGSTKHQPPEVRAQRIRQTFQEILAGAQIFAMSGAQPNPQRYLEILARYENMPEYLELLSSNNMPQEMGGGEGASQIGKPGGEYVHRSISGNQVDQGQQSLAMMAPAPEAA
jgi:hypothetical protein